MSAMLVSKNPFLAKQSLAAIRIEASVAIPRAFFLVGMLQC